MALAYGQLLMNYNLKSFTTDTIKIALVTSTYVPDQDAHTMFSNITGEVSGTGYTAGGATLGTKTMTYDAASNTIKIDAADVTWANSTLANVTGWVIYQSTGTASTSPLICYETFTAKSSSSGNFNIVFDSAGILTVVTSAT